MTSSSRNLGDIISNETAQTRWQGLFYLSTVDTAGSYHRQFFFGVPCTLSALSYSLPLSVWVCVCVWIFSQTRAESPAEASCTAVSLVEALCVGTHSCALKEDKMSVHKKGSGVVQGNGFILDVQGRAQSCALLLSLLTNIPAVVSPLIISFYIH